MTDRVLIVKLAALGDVIMASTLIPAIRAQWPTAEITWLVGEGSAPLVRLLSGVDHVRTVNERALLAEGKWSSLRAIGGAWRAVGRGFDWAIVGHTDARYATLAWVSGARTIRRFAGGDGPRAGEWHGAGYARLAPSRPVHGTTNATPARYASVRRDALPASPAMGGDAPLAVLAPGGGRNVLRDDPLRRWPLPMWISLTRRLVSRGYRVVAAGGPSDVREGAACGEAGAIDLTGRTTLLELIALINSAHSVVTHDSGTMHLALLLDRPTVALFGPTVPVERIPEGARATVLSRAAGLACAPCYDGAGYASCSDNLCINRVPVASVVEAVERQVADPEACVFQASSTKS
ncbi:MAG: glycosyltransferase family 9 protein [Gemmatimonas sp.]